MKEVNALSLYELTKYARAVAQEAGLGVATSRKGYSYLEGKTIYIAPEKVPVNQERAIYQLRKIIHEVAHYTDSDMDLWSKIPLKQESMLRSLWNLVEDHRIEYVQSQRYDGDADILDAGTAVACAGALKSAAEATAKLAPEQVKEINPLVGSLALDVELRGEWQPSLASVEPKLTPEQEEIRAKLAPYKDEIRKARQVSGKMGTAIAYSVAKKLFEALGGDVEKEEEEGQKAAQKGGAAGHGEKIEKGDTELEKAKGMCSLSPQEEGTNEYFDHNYDGGGKGAYGIGIANACMPEHFYVDNHANPAKSSYGSKKIEGSDYSGYTRREYTDSITRARAYGSSSDQLAQKMRRLVQIKTRSRTQYGLKSGKIHGASLHRIVANVPGYSERVFKQRIDNFDIDSAVCVCVDMSGSMGGEKMTHAAVAAEMLSETVGNALGVPLMIYGFSETAPINGSPEMSPSIFVLRDFNERQLPTERMRERTLNAIVCSMGNNPDGDAVIWGYHQLRAAKGKRKILFVLSDGSPASARKGNQGQYLKHVVQQIERTPIKLFGLGLEDASVRHYYKHHAVVSSATDIEPKIIQLVDNFILEGK